MLRRLDSCFLNFVGVNAKQIPGAALELSSGFQVILAFPSFFDVRHWILLVKFPPKPCQTGVIWRQTRGVFHIRGGSGVGRVGGSGACAEAAPSH